MKITYNGNEYDAVYNEQSGYYELQLQAPENGGIYNTEIEYVDVFENTYTSSFPIQIFAKQKKEINLEKFFMWIFDYKDFSVKDIVEVSDFEINIDEETNANSTFKISKNTGIKSRDIVAFKRDNEVLYWGTVKNVRNENGNNLYECITQYITNLFDRKIILENENLIKSTGVEDFIEDSITNNFIANNDTLINLPWLSIVVKTHTTKNVSVSNVENGIYNLHTWLTNCTQNYDIVYDFNIADGGLEMTIEAKDYEKEIIDTTAQPISDYSEVFEVDVVSKVEVIYSKRNGASNKGVYTLYLKTDRTTTTNINDANRADGKVEAVYTENYEDANQVALDTMKTNAYNHNITFSYYNRFIKIGTPIAIKTKESLIYDTYISAIKITKKKFVEYICGNIRIKFIDILKQERRN